MPQNIPIKGTILIVDDIPDNLRLLSSLLKEQGYKVRPAPSGKHALVSVRKAAPDLILLDVMMPEMNGYEVCRTLKSDKRTCDIPVIFLSALDEIRDKVRGFEVGGVDYITKPFHEKEVLIRVETHLKIRTGQQNILNETIRFKSLTEAAFEAIVIHSDWRIIDVNPAALRMFDRAETELIGSDLLPFLSPEIRQPLLTKATGIFEGEVLCEADNRVPVEVRSRNMPLKDRIVSVTALRDLTRQKQMELEKKQLLQENSALKMTIQDRYRFGNLIGRSPAMQTVYTLISKAAASMFPVIITGESGTGKELTAQTIHAMRYADNEPFVTVNCGAISESLFEREFFGHRKGSFTDALRDEPGYLDAAHGGTLFLDEIAELPLAMQVKLLRVLETGEYIPVGGVKVKKAQARIIAATNTDLTDLVRQGKFREDLFYRIHVIEITLPPLRNRREDIHLLVEHFFARNNATEAMAQLPARFREILDHYDWPGNVRELLNTIQRYLATDMVTLPGYPQNTSADTRLENGLHDAVENLERKMIVDALQKTNWHRGDTAELLKIPRRSLLRKIQKYELQQPG